MKQTSNSELLAGYDKIWQKGIDVRHKYSRFDWNGDS
jgi:hypothetical protein